MVKFALIVIVVLMVGVIGLSGALAIAIKRAERKAKKELEELDRKHNEYNKKAEGIINDANKKKDSLHTGDANTDFNNSINILSDKQKKD